jgi:GNAT superfamily N-acetyltransferase
MTERALANTGGGRSSPVRSLRALRAATTDDLPAIRTLIQESVRGLSEGFYSPAQIESGLTYVFGADTQLIADGTYYVIHDDGGMIACGGWSRRATLYGGDQHKSAVDPFLDPELSPARIRAFFVHPGRARQGLGRMLFDACIAAARRARFSAFELGATLPGVPLYLALGFESRARLDATLPDGVVLPIVRMWRAFDTRA